MQSISIPSGWPKPASARTLEPPSRPAASLLVHKLALATNDSMLRNLSAYTCGEDAVCKAVHAGPDVDSRTTGRDYSCDAITGLASSSVWAGSEIAVKTEPDPAA